MRENQAVFPHSALPRPDYPRPTLRRSHWVNLNGEWEFGAGDRETFDRTIVVPFCPQSRLSGIGVAAPGDVVWYRRRFDAPTADRLLLHFGAVDYRATVWVNGEEVAAHEGGHTPFSADISAVVRRQDNVVVVRAEDPLADKTIPRGKQFWTDTPESIFYTATTGIWQTVWLEPMPARAILSVRLQPSLDDGALTFEIVGDGHIELTVSQGGAVVGRWGGIGGDGHIELDRVLAWSPDAPHLYDLEVRLLDTFGDELDRVSSYFGLRKVETREGRVFLNGEPLVQRLVLDQGYFPGGLLTAASDAELRLDIELAKAMGFNGARKHQKVEDPRWLYWADRLGFLVWGEMANFHQHSADAERRLTNEWREAVLRDRQHPSIVAWVPMNESFGMEEVADETKKAAFLNRLYHLTHELDSTRLVMSNDGWEHTTSDLCTLHDYAPAGALRERYRSHESSLQPDGRPRKPYLRDYQYRGEPMVVSEFGGVALAGSPGFGWSTAAGSQGLLDTYREMLDALMSPGPVEGFCYTQLTDVEQEQNGLLTFERRPKVAPELIRPITQTPKRR
jgi:beta-galactosidase/beta-glucuronidase